MAKPKKKNEKNSKGARQKSTSAGSPKSSIAESSAVSERSAAKNKKEKGQVKVSAKRAKPVAAKSAAPKPSFIDKSKQFLREVKIELKKVTWPSRKEAMGTTAVVLVLVAILSIYLGIVDAGLTSALTSLMR